MRQIVYSSVATSSFRMDDLGSLLYDARYLNRRSNVTGLLLFDGQNFLQALEGDWRNVGDTLARISKDKRHHSIAILSDRTTDRREFGNWDMATKVLDASDYTKSLKDLISGVTQPEIKMAFEAFAAAKLG
ncbi:MAG: hypothetical protein RLZZ136_1212 [Pseudomonadota bacterium]